MLWVPGQVLVSADRPIFALGGPAAGLMAGRISLVAYSRARGSKM